MAECGACKYFVKDFDSARGKCKLRKHMLTRRRTETKIEFRPYRSRWACKMFEKGGAE